MQICKIRPDRLHEALDLIWEVFQKFEAPEYDEMGVQVFRHFITYSSMVEKIDKGEMIFWGCYLNNYLVGVIAVRFGRHISLLFVRERFHRLGVAKKLMGVALDFVQCHHPEAPAVTVNSSPYAVEIYRRMGFQTLGGEQKKDGIRFTPMRFNF